MKKINFWKLTTLIFFLILILLLHILFNLINEEEINKNIKYTDLENSLILSQKWFDNYQNETNIFYYTYFPENNSFSNEKNMVRNIGSFWGYVRLYNFNSNNQSLKQINKIRKNIQNYIKYDNINSTEIAYIEYNGVAEINTQAFYILALSELKKSRIKLTQRELDDLEKIINGIYLMKAKEGGLWYIYYLPEKDNKISPYGTSETLFALISYYKYIEQDEKVLKFSKEVFEEYFKIAGKYKFDQEEARSFYSWILYFLTELNEIDDSYYSYLEDLLNKGLGYRSNNPSCKDEGCIMFQITNSEAAFLEGNIIAYDIANKNNYSRINELKEYINLTYINVLNMQVKSVKDYENKTGNIFNGNPDLLVGGFCGGRNDGDYYCETLRNDFTQHASSALLNYYLTFNQQSWP